MSTRKIISGEVKATNAQLINEIAALKGVIDACATMLEGHTRGYPLSNQSLERMSQSLSDSTGRKYGETLNGQGQIDWGEHIDGGDS